MFSFLSSSTRIVITPSSVLAAPSFHISTNQTTPNAELIIVSTHIEHYWIQLDRWWLLEPDAKEAPNATASAAPPTAACLPNPVLRDEREADVRQIEVKLASDDLTRQKEAF
jgi:hypothetical protein